MKKWFRYFFIISIILFTFGCQSAEEDPITQEEPQQTVRDLFTYSLSFPAVWNESTEKTFVNKIGFANDEEFYFFYLTTEGVRQIQIEGRTEVGSIRRDYTKSSTPGIFVNDMFCFLTPLRDPAALKIGGIDNENNYTSIEDLDQFAVSATSDLDIASYLDFKGYKTQFASITKAHFLGEDTYRDNYFLAGNGYDNAGTIHPFIVTYNMQRLFNAYDSITTLAFFNEYTGVEALTVRYDWETESLFLLGYDVSTEEVVVLRYKEVDVNGNHVHDKNDSFNKTWEKRLSIIVDKKLFDCAFTDGNIFIGGTSETSDGDFAGILIALDAANGNIVLDTLLDLSDYDDGFYGVTQSGANLFAYGYSNKTRSSTSPTSNGWALKLSAKGVPMTNHVYKEENAFIEITTAIGGYDQSYFNEYGYLAIGGYKKTSEGYKAFAAEFYHNYYD